jgi:hypothetical protein
MSYQRILFIGTAPQPWTSLLALPAFDHGGRGTDRSMSSIGVLLPIALQVSPHYALTMSRIFDACRRNEDIETRDRPDAGSGSTMDLQAALGLHQLDQWKQPERCCQIGALRSGIRQLA